MLVLLILFTSSTKLAPLQGLEEIILNISIAQYFLKNKES
jgi:hypothetical protein